VRDIESVEAVDDGTVVVTMTNTSYWHLHNVGGVPILPAHILEGVENWKSWQPAETGHPEVEGLTMLVGTGPFVFEEYRPGEYVLLKRHDGFWMLGEDNR
jgi:peptide/nickel transport system substrate-binding protein